MSTARINKINLRETKKDLVLGDTDAIYIPIDTFDQYENPYTMKGEEAQRLKAKINGVVVDFEDLSADIIITWCRKNGNSYSKCKENEPVDAIGIAWSNNVSAVSGNEIKVTVVNENVTDSSEKPFTSDTLTIAVKSQRAVKTLEFAEKSKVAAAGAQVSNTIRVKDQYGQPIPLDLDKGIGVRVTDSDNKVVDADSSIIAGDERKTFEQTAMLDKGGTYTITVYLKDNETTTFEQAKVKASYTLKVDKQKNLIHRIEVSDTVTVHKGNEKKTVSLSEVKSIQVGGSENPTKLEFDYKVFDEDGNEVALKDVDGEPVIPSNELIWTAQGTSTTKVTKSEEPNIFFVEIIDGETQGSVSVQLDYVRGGVESAPFVIPVSKEAPIPQDGTYEVVTLTYDDDNEEVLGKENVISQGYEMEDTADGQTFAVTAQDQYGDTCQDISLYTVTSSDNNVASVEVMSGQNGNTNKFTITPQAQGEAVILVYVSKSVIYSFTVTVVEGRK